MINLSKTQSIKQQILSAVSTGETLSLSQIRYLQDVLPEKDKVQSTGLNFDHSKSGTFEACGLTREQIVEAENEINNLIQQIMDSTDRPTKSEVIEKVLTQGSKTLFNVLIIDAVRRKFEEDESPDMSDMMKFMMLMAKMKGGDK